MCVCRCCVEWSVVMMMMMSVDFGDGLVVSVTVLSVVTLGRGAS